MGFQEDDELARIKKQIKEIWAHLFPEKVIGDQAAQLVTLTASGSSPSFTYAFTDSNGTAFTGVVPANAADRQDVDILAAGFGMWFPDGAGDGDLMVTEPIDWGECET